MATDRWRALGGAFLGRKGGSVMGGLIGAWLVLVGVGTMSMVTYDKTAGSRARAPARWPSEGSLAASPTGSTLVLFLHPRCPCGKATLQEFEAVARSCPDATKVVVIFQPSGADSDWTDTEITRRAAAIPGVRLVRDERGAEARRFGVGTSGEALAYDASGRLIFEGGLTVGRGVKGEIPARRALIAALNGRDGELPGSPVFGCAMFDDAPACAASAGDSH